MSISDDELQRRVEEGRQASSDDPDFRAYQKLFGLLGEQSAFQPTGIENSIIAKIELSRKRSAFREHLWLVTGIVFLLLIAIVAVSVSSFRIHLSGWQQSILALGTCGAFVIIVLNAVERRLLHH